MGRKRPKQAGAPERDVLDGSHDPISRLMARQPGSNVLAIAVGTALRVVDCRRARADRRSAAAASAAAC
jgi:hypothetical protein